MSDSTTQKRGMLHIASRTIIVTAVAILIQKLMPHLLPHGPAFDIPPQHQPKSSTVDPNNTSLRLSSGKLKIIHERIEEGKDPLVIHPETIVFDNVGTMYVMNEYAKLVSLTDFKPKEGGDGNILTAKATEVADFGMGRPLGGKFDGNGCLYYADVILGLARICILDGKPTSNVEILSSSVKLQDGSSSPIMYADDVDIGSKTGHIYFSDASDVFTDRNVRTGLLDFVYSSTIEGVRGKRTGRLLRYKPKTREVDILVPSGVAFANGVALDKDETYVLYISTYDASVMKYHLRGEKRSERVLDNFTGFLDGVDCSFRNGLCYIAIPSTLSPLVKTIFSLTPWVGKSIRSFLMMIPRTWSPQPEPYGGVAEIHPGDDSSPARIVRIFQDPNGKDMSFITGVTEHEGSLYLGSLHNNHVGVLSLD